MATSAASRLSSLPSQFGFRLVAAMLLVSLPLMLVLAAILTRSASSSLTVAAERGGIDLAKAVTLRLEDWLGERRANLAVIASEAAETGLDSGEAVDHMLGTDESYDEFSLIEITDALGTVVASSQVGIEIAPAGQPWFEDITAGEPVITSPVLDGEHILWVMAEPVVGPDGETLGAVVARLNPLSLGGLLDPELQPGHEVVVLDAADRVVYDTDDMADAVNDTELIEAGALRVTAFNPAAEQAIDDTQPGAAHFTDDEGQEVIGGYDLVDELSWVLIAQTDAHLALAPVAIERRRALLVVALGVIVAVVVSLVLAARTSRPLRRLAATSRLAAGGDLAVRARPEGSSELVTLGQSINAMLETCERLVTQTAVAGVGVNSAAAQLSASSEELAATTTQQSAAVTQATATTEELARASAAIAETVDGVARQTAETRDNLEQAEADITLSSERTLALAERVNDIDALRGLINDIADQTNLLALNAAIEAARAGEHGLGFAVVADEVRRLAERSKTSAGDIATIVTAVQSETNATVMAMEKGAKQMHRGLTLLAAVTDAAGQVRLTTQQQRSANAQVVETMEQLTDASRLVTATAQQIAAAAGDLADLASNLETTAAGASNGSSNVSSNVLSNGHR